MEARNGMKMEDRARTEPSWGRLALKLLRASYSEVSVESVTVYLIQLWPTCSPSTITAPLL